MNIKKRFVAICLVTAAALSLVLSTPAKCTKITEGGQSSLLCDLYEEPAAKRC